MNRKFAGLFAGFAFIFTGLSHGADAPVVTPPPQVTPPASAPVEKIAYSSCHVEGPYIAITFDDGPSATLTPKLLDMLKARGIKATFFMVGQNAAEYPDIVKRISDEGHELGNHSWSHPQLTRLGPDALRAEIVKTSNAIHDATGKYPTVMRPPYGATSSTINHWLNKEFGMKVILWDVDPLDWQTRNSAHVESVIVAQTKPGSIILAHDIHATTVAAMPEVFDKLLAKGYKFVTVSELIAMDKPLPPPEPKKETATASPSAQKQQKHKKSGP